MYIDEDVIMRENIQTGLLTKIKQETAADWRNAYLDEKCIVRWKSNNRVPFEDMLYKFVIARLITQRVADDSEVVRQKEQDDFLADYKKARANRTREQIAEEAFEMRAAFGEGETIVDVFTGEKVIL